MSFFDQIDKEFANKTKQELYMSYFLVVLVIGFLIYYFIYPNIESNYKKEVDLKKSLTQSINAKKNNVLLIEGKINRANMKIEKLKTNITKLNSKINVLKKEVDKLSFVEFDANKWAKLLKDSVVLMIKEGMNIEILKSQVLDVKDYLKCFVESNSNNKGSKIKCKKMNNNYKFINKKIVFTISMQGDYKNLIAYIYQYENSKDLFRVDSLSLKPNQYIMTFSLYGYEQ